MKWKLLVLISFLVFFSIPSCKGKKGVVSLTAAGLKDPFLQMLQMYKEKNPQVEVETVFSGSGSLLVKLENRLGDLYIPASLSYMREAIKRGLIEPNTVKILAYHKPVLVVRKELTKRVKSIFDLVKEGIRLGIADPREAAIGLITKKILIKASLWQKIQKNIVVKTPTVNQLLLYLQSGQIDAAVIWKELVSKLSDVEIVEFPPQLVELEPIPVGITTFSKNRNEAFKFESFLLKHREIFKKYGFEIKSGGKRRN